MSSFIGYKPNHRTERSYTRRREPPTVPSDLIQVLPKLLSYAPADRLRWKKCLIGMLRSTGTIWLLKNVLRDVPDRHATTRSAQPLPATPFTPVPTHVHDRSHATAPHTVTQALWRTPGDALTRSPGASAPGHATTAFASWQGSTSNASASGHATVNGETHSASALGHAISATASGHAIGASAPGHASQTQDESTIWRGNRASTFVHANIHPKPPTTAPPSLTSATSAKPSRHSADSQARKPPSGASGLEDKHSDSRPESDRNSTTSARSEKKHVGTSSDNPVKRKPHSPGSVSPTPSRNSTSSPARGFLRAYPQRGFQSVQFKTRSNMSSGTRSHHSVKSHGSRSAQSGQSGKSELTGEVLARRDMEYMMNQLACQFQEANAAQSAMHLGMLRMS
jgi:hypothetical protein